MFGDLDWPLNATRGFVSISWTSCDPRDVVSAVHVHAYAGVAGCLFVTRRTYCIKMAEPILKRFQPSGSPIILVSSDPWTDTQVQGYPFSGGVQYTGGGKIWRFSCDFRRKSPFISETVQDRSIWLLWNVNRKSWVPDWMVSLLMTLSDP